MARRGIVMRIHFVATLALGAVLVLHLAAGESLGKDDSAPALKERLEVRANLRVAWEDEDENSKSQGAVTVHVQGMLAVNRPWVPEEAKMLVALMPYRLERGTAAYTYERRIWDKEPPEGCDALREEFVGQGNVKIEKIENPGVLLVHLLGTMAKQHGLGRYAPPQAQAVLVDYYELFLHAATDPIVGRVRNPSDCGYREEVRTASLGIEVRYRMGDQGEMSGSTSWTSRLGGSPAVQVRVSDLPEPMNSRPYVPTKEPGKARYQLSWRIEEPVVLTIERQVRGTWSPLDDAAREVVHGESVRLRGVFQPLDEPSVSGTWEIDGGNLERTVKTFEVTLGSRRGRRVPLDPKEDLQGPSVEVQWFRGAAGEVQLRVERDGQVYRAEERFELQRPEFDVSWIGREGTTWRKLGVGDPTLFEQWPAKNRPGDSGYREDRDASGRVIPPPEYHGPQYDGILFRCAQQTKHAGETQWVQIIEETQHIEDFEERYLPDTRTGHDHACPVATGDSFYDAPGLPASKSGPERRSWSVTMRFELSLMFRPAADGSEWVPVKRVRWGWQCKASRDRDENGQPTDWTFEAQGPVDGQLGAPRAEDADAYPEWTQNSADW